MQRFLLFSLTLLYATSLLAQKPVIDTGMYASWPSVEDAAISNDGKYVLYYIKNQPAGSSSLVLKAANLSWEKVWPGARQAAFAPDNHTAVFINQGDSLCLLTLGTAAVSYIPDVQSFQVPAAGEKLRLAYQPKAPGREVVIYDPASSSKKQFPGVSDYVWSEDGAQLAFTRDSSSVWNYRLGQEEAILLANNQSRGIDTDFQLHGVLRFSRDGRSLLCVLKQKFPPKPGPDAVMVDIWHYKDKKLQSQQLKELGNLKDTISIGINNRRIAYPEQQEFYDAALLSAIKAYGDKHHLMLQPALELDDTADGTAPPLLLTALNKRTKENGFYRLAPGKAATPEPLVMGPYLYHIPGKYGEAPVKARNEEAYIVRRESATQSPNYYYTKDFKTFSPLSNLHPETACNWFTTELHSWQSPDGDTLQGVLYKPENFDPAKRYPVIFYYNERMSDRLHLYLTPGPSDGRLNIPWYVSNGYLVFSPDIHYKMGAPGQSIYDAVTSAADYLARQPWVDAKHMGLQGFELGAYATNYLVTRTGRFAAACAAAGFTDLISAHGALDENGASMMPKIEGYPYCMGAPLWEAPERYIENSPVLGADEITTPLLMMHNKKDEVVPFAQGVELITGLRRLGKTGWMLQYDDCAHTLSGPPAMDFSIRMTQFFAHYLKGAPAPIWMTRGIPARLKGIETGLELDSLSVPPPGGLLRMDPHLMR